MKITLITPTGGRPEAFALCEKYIKAQTLKPYEWIVIDDMDPKTTCTLGQKYFRGPRLWEPEYNTQRGNMEEALHHVTGEALAIIEDDDYYAPNYLEAMAASLQYAEISGLANSRYYGLHVPGWKEMNNWAHASLSQTVLRATHLQSLKKAVISGELYFDVILWRNLRSSKIPMTLLANTSLSVGIKGMPGRMGITGSHRDRDYYIDSSLKKLHEWVGDASENYIPFTKARSKPITKVRPNYAKSKQYL